MPTHPRLVNTVLDATDARELAEFYRRLLGLEYRPGDEPGADGEEVPDWLVLVTPAGRRLLAFQRVETLHRTTWPSPDVPMQMHLCFSVDEPGDLDAQRERAESLGARLLLHRTDEPDEPLYVLADPAGHPFCLYTHPSGRLD
ncbi:VOC family protein [Kineococcus indalonis]|uniref:VOC family protein n=1 Tax=Kineococcus indalonis TaxID=2696566 RepID=UPI0014121B50|nr:VOC family protein [Kineococcus indalonis]NAZ84890.1 VOC family protein [Kineococcus indalonis]